MREEQAEESPTPDEMRPEYDFSGGVRGKYAERYRRGVAELPPESESVDRTPPEADVGRKADALPDDLPSSGTS
jgi:hypothetical protein